MTIDKMHMPGSAFIGRAITHACVAVLERNRRLWPEQHPLPYSGATLHHAASSIESSASSSAATGATETTPGVGTTLTADIPLSDPVQVGSAPEAEPVPV